MDMLTRGVERTALQANQSAAETQPDSASGLPGGEPCASAASDLAPQMCAKPGEVTVLGLTIDGKKFRPGDWAERLAGAMSSFRPEGSVGGIAAYIGYSPYCVPTTTEKGIKCVIVSEELRKMEPMAWDFVMNFARDNKLQSCSAPRPVDVQTAGAI